MHLTYVCIIHLRTGTEETGGSQRKEQENSTCPRQGKYKIIVMLSRIEITTPFPL